ncbi:MAG: AzlC family ABC transporter permease [Paracoccus sp. (in: a-proteobacteria)]|nr:AzlC family ABC transporter permease [Paracoccus sp. (in: a-proteobacteria)]
MTQADRQPETGSISQGMRAALPIAIGYLPAAFAFGAAASGIGLGVGQAGALSAFVFSGANQVFLLAAIPAGMAPALIVGLTSAASLRHLLYGLVLRPRIGGTRRQRLIFAAGLTDEVFAAALARPADAPRPSGPWLIGLGLTAWAAWLCGTLIGAAAGEALSASSVAAGAAMGFALPALFMALVIGSVRRAVLLPMLMAAGVAAVLITVGQPDLAIPAGALMAFLARRPRPAPTAADPQDHLP